MALYALPRESWDLSAPSTSNWPPSFHCTVNLLIAVWLSLGMLDRAADTLCLVRRGCLQYPFWVVPDHLVQQSVGLSLPEWNCACRARRPCTFHAQELSLPGFASWHKVGAYWMLVNCGILLETKRFTVHKKILNRMGLNTSICNTCCSRKVFSSTQ